MSEIKEALAFLAEQAVTASKCEVVDLGQHESNGLYGVLNKVTGKLERFAPNAPLRDYEAHSVGSFCALLKRHSETDTSLAIYVFVADTGDVIALLDEEGDFGRQERISLVLTRTPEFNTLSEPPTRWSQRDMINRMRLALHRTGIDDLLGKIRHVKFGRNDAGEMKITQGAQSLSRAVTDKLDSGDSLFPDSVELAVHLYEELVDLIEANKLECVFDVDPSNDRPFLLTPFAGELPKAIQKTRDLLVTEIEKQLSGAENVHVFAGAPTTTR